MAALFAGAPRVVGPEIPHRLAEVFDDVTAVKVNVFHQSTAFFAVKDYMLLFSGWPPPLDHNADRIRRPDWRMRDIRRNKESFTFTHQMINDSIVFAYPYLDVAFELVKIFLRVDEMEIVPGVRPFNYHHEEVAAVIKILIADRRLEFFPVLINPVLEIDGRLNS